MDSSSDRKEGSCQVPLKSLMAQQRTIYDRKNTDYDNSFHHTVERFGLVAALVCVTDKMERIKRLQHNTAQTQDESLCDTVSDALNYLLMFGAEMVCGTWNLADESRVEGQADNITLVHKMMDALAEEELLLSEKANVDQILELWDEMCDTTMQAMGNFTPEKVDDLLTVNHYLAGQMAAYLLQLTA